MFPMDAVAQALSDPIRREILQLLHEQPRTAGAIAGVFTVSRPAVSRHLRVLREAGLVRDELTGRERAYRLMPDALVDLETFVAELRRPSPWQRRFLALDTEVHRVKRRRASSRANPSRADKSPPGEKETA